MKIQLRLVIIILISLSCHVSSQKTVNLTQSRDTSISVNNSYNGLFFDSLQLENFIALQNIKDSLAAAMRNFYDQRNYQYAWFFKEGMADYANTFMGQQDEYISYSRDSSIYNPILEATFDSLSDTTSYNPPDSIRLKTEFLLTAQFFRYSAKAFIGKNLNTKDLGWYIPRKKISPVILLDSLLQNQGKNFSQYEPLNRQYNLLKNYLLKYYQAEKEGLWQPITADKKSYKQGDSSPAITQIKKRLLLTGDMTINDTSSVFTDSLASAIKRYQHRYGLTEDGAAGPSVLKEMNRGISDRIHQILINMERIRWLPAEPTGDFLLVNIPEFRLHVYDNGNYKWNMRVVVGAIAHNTVIFNGNLKYIVFSPYWNVPKSIINKEIIPGMKRDKNYLANHNMEWNNGAVRQKPGLRNSLGLVKFLFPNSYNIYLHDTPSKSLFNESKRAFSHGCIRLSEPKKLAEYLLRNDPAWNDAKITRAMNSRKEQYVTLKEPVPVFIGYFTAWVDRDGKLNFRDDIYGHDKKMEEHLFAASKK